MIWNLVHSGSFLEMGENYDVDNLDYHSPRYLEMDETFDVGNEQNEDDVRNMNRAAPKGRTTMLVCHNMEVTRCHTQMREDFVKKKRMVHRIQLVLGRLALSLATCTGAPGSLSTTSWTGCFKLVVEWMGNGPLLGLGSARGLQVCGVHWGTWGDDGQGDGYYQRAPSLTACYLREFAWNGPQMG